MMPIRHLATVLSFLVALGLAGTSVAAPNANNGNANGHDREDNGGGNGNGNNGNGNGNGGGDGSNGNGGGNSSTGSAPVTEPATDPSTTGSIDTSPGHAPTVEPLPLDQDAALTAVEKHRAMPLEDLMGRVTTEVPGTLVDAQLIEVGSFLLYELRVLQPNGHVSRVYYYASSGMRVTME